VTSPRHGLIFPSNDGHRHYAIFLASNCAGLM
jgi:hypothetical protein